MSQPSALRVHWPALFAVFTIVALGILALLAPDGSRLRTVALVLWGAVPTALAISRYAYDKIERYRLSRIGFVSARPIPRAVGG